MSSADDRQLALPFKHDPSMAGEDYFVADCNLEAVSWLDRWPHWPTPALVVHGPEGCGKSHLLTAFVARTGAEAWSGDPVDDGRMAPDETRPLPPLVIDDGPLVLRRSGEPAFLHRYNWRIERGGSVLIAADRPPSRWSIALPDLRSRLAAAMTAGIGAPDDGVLRAMAVKQFRDRRVSVDDALLDYILARCERSFAAVASVVAALDAASLRWKRPVTVALAQRVLAASARGEDAPPLA